MSNWLVIKKSGFQGKAWRRPANLARLAETVSVPAYTVELSHLLRTHALGFRRDAAGAYHLEVLLSLSGEFFPFITSDHRWISGYIPAAVRQYPFALEETEKGAAVSFDGDSGLLIDVPGADDILFFDESGRASAEFAQIQEFLAECHSSQKATERAVAALAEEELLDPWIVRNQGTDQEQVLFYSVNEAKLGRLEPPQMTVLNALGALKVAYAQLFSQPRVRHLSLLEEQLRKSGTGEELDLESLFDDDNENLTF